MTKTVEFKLALYGISLNFIWEMLQMPLFIFPEKSSLLSNTIFCLQASLGDVVILLIMYESVVFISGDRGWISNLKFNYLAVFISLGIIITIIIEAISVNWLGRWNYQELMPRLPILGTGLAPLLQWVVIPLLVLFHIRNSQRLI